MQPSLKLAAKFLLSPLMFRYPPCGLKPERLAQYLSAIEELEAVPGSIVEIGAYHGGTAIMARRMMDALGQKKDYICIDTFGGFPANAFARDMAQGTPQKDASRFSDNSLGLVRKIVKRHGCEHIVLRQQDCEDISYSDFPDGVSLCLIDVDLSSPVQSALKAIWPALSLGGRVYVDDCFEQSSWKALVGLRAFCAERQLEYSVRHGLGKIEKTRALA